MADILERLSEDSDSSEAWADGWTSVDLLSLASSVLRSGDKNWVSVSRSIKPFGDPKRPADWYTPKKCALQYSKLLKMVEDMAEKKSLPRTERETPEEVLVKHLTNRRMEELSSSLEEAAQNAELLQMIYDKIGDQDFDCTMDEMEVPDIIRFIDNFEERYSAQNSSFNQVKQIDEGSCPNPFSRSRYLIPCYKSKAPIQNEPEEKNKVENNESNLHTEFRRLITDVVEVKEEPVSERTELNKPKLSSGLSSLLPRQPAHGDSEAPRSVLSNTLLETKNTSSTIVQSNPVSRSFFNPSSALACAAARQLAVATSSVPNHVGIFMAHSGSDPSCLPAGGTNYPVSSVTSSAPTLSKLLEMPPSRPGKLPSLPNSPCRKEYSSSTIASPEKSNSSVKDGKTISSDFVKSKETTLSSDDKISKKNTEHSTLLAALKTDYNERDVTGNVSKKVECSTGELGKAIEINMDSKVVVNVSDTASQNITSESTVSSLSETEESSIESGLLVLNNDNEETCEKELEIKKLSPSVSDLFDMVESQKKNSIPDIPHISTLRKDSSNIEIGDTQKSEKLLGSSFTLLENSNALALKRQPLKFHASAREKIRVPHMKRPEGVSEIDWLLNPDKCCKDVTHLSAKLPNEWSAASVSFSNQSDLPSDDTLSLDSSENSSKPDESLKPKSLVTAVANESSIAEKQPLCDTPESKESSPVQTRKTALKASLHNYSELPTNKNKKQKISKVTQLKEEVSVTENSSQKERIQTAESSTRTSEKKAENSTKEQPKSEKGESSSNNSTDVEQQTTVRNASKSDENNGASEYEKSDSKAGPMLRRQSRKPRTLREYTRRGRRGGRFISKNRGTNQKPKENSEASPKPDEESQSFEEIWSLIPACESLIASKNKDIEAADNKAKEDEKLAKGNQKSTSRPGRRGCRSRGRTKNVSVEADSIMEEKKGKHKLQVSDETESKMETDAKILKSSQPNDKLGVSKKTENCDSAVKDANDSSREPQTSSNDTKKCGSSRQEEIDSENVSVEEPNKSAAPENAIDLNECSSASPASTLTADEISPKVKEEKDDNKPWSPQSSNPASQSVVTPTTSDISDESDNSEDSDESDDQSSNATENKGYNKTASKRKGKDRDSQHQDKRWKKSISMVWREASYHKFANVFSQKVTDDVAPGYESIVNRPMDLSLIKKNIDNGTITTVHEFQRDMMLMFQNAIMYNSSDHDVYKMAVAMQTDVNKQIQDFLATQLLIQDNNDPSLSTSLRVVRNIKTNTKTQRGSSSKSNNQ